MSNPGAAGTDSKDNAIAKTAGIVVFSGIALSILKALNPLNRNRTETKPFSESTQPIQMPTSQPPPPKPQELIFKVSHMVDDFVFVFSLSILSSFFVNLCKKKNCVSNI